MSPVCTTRSSPTDDGVGTDLVSARSTEGRHPDAWFALPADVRDVLHAVAQELAAHQNSFILSEAKNPTRSDVDGRVVSHSNVFTLDDYNAFDDALTCIAKKRGIRLTAKLKKDIQAAVAVNDESAKPVVRKRTATGIEYEPDPDLRDTEQIPLTESVDDFMAREVLPYAPDAWVADGPEKIGYEISFTRYFYKPQQLRTLARITARVRAIVRSSISAMSSGQFIGGALLSTGMAMNADNSPAR